MKTAINKPWTQKLAFLSRIQYGWAGSSTPLFYAWCLNHVPLEASILLFTLRSKRHHYLSNLASNKKYVSMMLLILLERLQRSACFVFLMNGQIGFHPSRLTLLPCVAYWLQPLTWNRLLNLIEMMSITQRHLYMPCICFIFRNAKDFSCTTRFLAGVPRPIQGRQNNEDHEWRSKPVLILCSKSARATVLEFLLLWWRTATQNNFGRKELIRLKHPYHSYSLKEAKGRTQARQTPGCGNCYTSHGGMLLTDLLSWLTQSPFLEHQLRGGNALIGLGSPTSVKLRKYHAGLPTAGSCRSTFSTQVLFSQRTPICVQLT